MDADEFMDWLGAQLEEFLELPVDTGDRIKAGQRLCEEAKRILDDMSQKTFASTKSKFNQVWERGTIGSFKIPFDDEQKDNWAGDILGTIDGFFEWLSPS